MAIGDAVKNDQSARKSQILAPETTPGFVRDLAACMERTTLACQALHDDLRRQEDCEGRKSSEWQSRRAALEDEVVHLREENANMKAANKALEGEISQLHQKHDLVAAELHECRSNHNLLVGDMGRLCHEKQKILNDRDTAVFQKSLNELILDQYRDETREQRQTIASRDAELQDLARTCASLDFEVSSLRGWCRGLERCVTDREQAQTEAQKRTGDGGPLPETETASATQSENGDPSTHAHTAVAVSTTAESVTERQTRKRGSRRQSRKGGTSWIH